MKNVEIGPAQNRRSTQREEADRNRKEEEENRKKRGAEGAPGIRDREGKNRNRNCIEWVQEVIGMKLVIHMPETENGQAAIRRAAAMLQAQYTDRYAADRDGRMEEMRQLRDRTAENGPGGGADERD